MVQYYGRARMRTGSVNRNQGKASGSVSSTGSTATIRRNVSRRVNNMARVGCVVQWGSNGRKAGSTMMEILRPVFPTSGFLLIPQAPKSRASAGGVYVLAGSRRR